MKFLVEGEVVTSKFEGALSCRRRLFFGKIILTNYRLITVSSSIQKNTGYKSDLSKHPFQVLTVRLKRDAFLAKLNKQKLAESILHLEKVYQFPTTKVLKRKVKKNQFVYDATLEYEDKGALKKELVRIRIQPKRDSYTPYKEYKIDCGKIFKQLDKALKIE